MKMTFYTPANGEVGTFGAASFGFAGAENENAEAYRVCADDLEGVVLTGSYAQILDAVPAGEWQAGVVLLGNGGNENAFVRALAEKTKAPLTGGAAAMHPVTGERALVTGRGEAAVFLIRDPRYTVEVVSQNIHTSILGEHRITFSGRWIDEIDGEPAKPWLEAQKAKLGIAATDFEHLTFSDAYGINAHLSEVDGRIFSGRDLEETMILRHVPHETVQTAMQAFYTDADAVVFGCAGLKGILDAGLSCDGTGLFMFGEVCTIDGHSDFGNLMLSKLRIVKK